MVSLRRLKDEGLIPVIQPDAKVVAYSDYFVNWWDGILSKDIKLNGKTIFSETDFESIYLQIEMNARENLEWVAVKMNVAEDRNKTGKPYDKETVRWARQKLQDYFMKNIPNCSRIRFQFQSPKDNVEHAYWLTICRVYYDETNYKKRITDTQKAFDALK